MVQYRICHRGTFSMYGESASFEMDFFAFLKIVINNCYGIVNNV